MSLELLLRDEEYREALAEAAYMRERVEDAAADREHELEEASYFALAWSSLSDHARRPYRTAVAETCEAVLGVTV